MVDLTAIQSRVSFGLRLSCSELHKLALETLRLETAWTPSTPALLLISPCGLKASPYLQAEILMLQPVLLPVTLPPHTTANSSTTSSLFLFINSGYALVYPWNHPSSQLNILPLMEAQNQMQWPDKVWHVLSRRDSPCSSLALRDVFCSPHWVLLALIVARGCGWPCPAHCLPEPNTTPQRCCLALPAPDCIPEDLYFPRAQLSLYPCWISWSSVRHLLPTFLTQTHGVCYLSTANLTHVLCPLLITTGSNVEQQWLIPGDTLLYPTYYPPLDRAQPLEHEP